MVHVGELESQTDISFSFFAILVLCIWVRVEVVGTGGHHGDKSTLSSEERSNPENAKDHVPEEDGLSSSDFLCFFSGGRAASILRENAVVSNDFSDRVNTDYSG